MNRSLVEEEVLLRCLEYLAWAFLVRNAGNVVTKEQISEAAWMGETAGNHNIAVMIAVLRSKLNDDHEQPRYIETIHGIGFVLLYHRCNCRYFTNDLMKA